LLFVCEQLPVVWQAAVDDGSSRRSRVKGTKAKLQTVAAHRNRPRRRRRRTSSRKHEHASRAARPRAQPLTPGISPRRSRPSLQQARAGSLSVQLRQQHPATATAASRGTSDNAAQLERQRSGAAANHRREKVRGE
jgi:hypothetical protein